MKRIFFLLTLASVCIFGIQAAKPSKSQPQKIASSIAASLNKPTKAFKPSPATDKIVMSVNNGSIQYFNSYSITVTPGGIALTVMSSTTSDSATETFSFPTGKSFKGLLKTVEAAQVTDELNESMVGMCGGDYVSITFYKGGKAYHEITNELQGDPAKIENYIRNLIPHFYNELQSLIDQLDSPGIDPFDPAYDPLLDF